MGLTRAHGVFYKGKRKKVAKLVVKLLSSKKKLLTSIGKTILRVTDPSLGIIPIRDDATCSWSCIDVDDYSIDVRKTINFTQN